MLPNLTQRNSLRPGFNVVVLLSGRGSNFKNLLDHASGYEIVAAISNNASAPGLTYADQEGIPKLVFERQQFSSLKEQKKALREKVEALDPDLVALAGFMQVLDREFVNAFYGRIINIHPALLPKYAGLDTHKRALAAGDTMHGCTVHFVDEGVDTGPIIAQASCPCYPGKDTEEGLAQRVLSQEHRLYPWVLSAIAKREITFDGRKVEYTQRARTEAKALSFTLPA